MKAVELFTGCGGLAMGLSRAGFESLRMSEWDRAAVVNVLHNKKRGIEHVRNWPIKQEDVRGVSWKDYAGIELIAGGPPCQPFSIGGRHRGHEDVRDMWPEAVRAIREATPKGFIFENVRGLLRPAFASYLSWVTLSLSYPDLIQRDGEEREHHLKRLLAAEKRPQYHVAVCKVNAADFGAAQKRHRVLIVGVRSELNLSLPRLHPTHSLDRLLWDQWITGEYWVRHSLATPNGGPDKAHIAAIRRLSQMRAAPATLPWRTVRDAISGLGEPQAGGQFVNHAPQPGARAYPGHTGSPLDMPAKALKAGVHGVPGGENMMAFNDGAVRYFTVREAARLQGLPDDYEFVGSWSENMRQCGNAVPSELAQAVGQAMREALGAEAKFHGSKAA